MGILRAFTPLFNVSSVSPMLTIILERYRDYQRVFERMTLLELPVTKLFGVFTRMLRLSVQTGRKSLLTHPRPINDLINA